MSPLDNVENNICFDDDASQIFCNVATLAADKGKLAQIFDLSFEFIREGNAGVGVSFAEMA